MIPLQAKVRDQKDCRLLPHQIRRQRLTEKKIRKKYQAAKRKGLPTEGAKFHVDTGFL